MDVKSLFTRNSLKKSSNSSMAVMGTLVESDVLISAVKEDREMFIPDVDFSKPENFAYYGSAKKYYEDSIKRIYQTYPYDGSGAEKQTWINDCSYLDRYLFDNLYPKTTGYLNLLTPSSTSSIELTYEVPGGEIKTWVETLSDPGQPYVSVLGGMNSGVSLKKSNIYDPSSGRDANFYMSGSTGNTVEFWWKFDKENYDLNPSWASSSFAIFDAWNGIIPIGNFTNCARFLIEFAPLRAKTLFEESAPFLVTYLNLVPSLLTGIHPQGAEFQPLGDENLNNLIRDGNWHHYAFSIINIEDDNNNFVLKFELFVDGQVYDTRITNNASTPVDKILNLGANLFSYQVSAVDNDAFAPGCGALIGSVDEFRFWKSRRSHEQIMKNWFCHVGGGTNTDDSNVELGIYYKFNEGITDSRHDTTVLDYSGRISNGVIQNYSSLCRSTGSAFDESGLFGIAESKDPIVYNFHSQVQSIGDYLVGTGELYDDTNNSMLINHMPDWIIEEDEKSSGLMKDTLQIVASYIDTLHMQIKKLPTLTHPEYPQNEPYKSKVKIEQALASRGFVVPEIFASAEVLETFGKRDNEQFFEEKIDVVRNLIYNNIYNNISSIYKSKGTEESYRNLLHCFGIDDSIVKLKSYTNDSEITIDESSTEPFTAKKRFVNFNRPGCFDSVVYQQSGSVFNDTTRFPFFNAAACFPWTLESTVIFPQKNDKSSANYFNTPFLSSSIMGLVGAVEDSTDTTAPDSDYADYRVYVVKSSVEPSDGKFVLDIPVYGVRKESDIIRDLYDGGRWTIALRQTQKNLVGGGTSNVELVAYKTQEDVVLQSIKLSALELTSSYQTIGSGSAAVRIYVGAKRTNITGSVEIYSDVLVGNSAFWLTDITDKNLLLQSKTGNLSHIRASSPAAKTKVLEWDFNLVDASDSAGEFVAADISGVYPAKGKFFPVNDSDIINIEYLPLVRQTDPDSVGSLDMVRIESDGESLISAKHRTPKDFMFSFEKSPYAAISDEMMRWFAGVSDFNNLIGEPVNRYRESYKPMAALRSIFFSRVEEKSSVEKYVEFYKWIDGAMVASLLQLVPASAKVSSNVSTVIESHLLERNKFAHKLPTIEYKEPALIGNINIGSNSSQMMQSLEHSIDIIRENVSSGKQYDEIMTCGRSGNKLDFVVNNASYINLPPLAPFGLGLSFTKPVRGVKRNVFVSKFASPGSLNYSTDTYRDREASEYSAYDGVDYRNLVDRRALDNKLALHSGQFGETDGTGSIHKINNNPVYRGSELDVLIPVYDNAFVQHAIPQSDRQYCWISSSVSGSETILGYLKDQEEITLSNSSSSYADWQQVRVGQKVSIKSPNISLVDPALETVYLDTKGNLVPVVARYGLSNTEYEESAVERFSPLRFHFNTKDSEENLVATVPYDSELGYFANPSLNDILNLHKPNKPKAYVTFRNAAVDEETQIRKVVAIVYNKNIFPKRMFDGNSVVRKKKNYDEIAGKSGNGFDRQTHRKMWDSTKQKRGRTYIGDSAINSVGVIDSRNSVWQLDASGSDNVVGRGIGGELNTHGFNYRAFTGHDTYYFTPATASILYAMNNRINFPETNEDGMPEWTADIESGLTPWYATYEDYVADLYPHAQEGYASIPEFRISDLMPFYVETRGGNFRSTTPQKFKLEGAEVTSSDNGTGVENEDFFKYNVHSDPITGLSEIVRDSSDLVKPKFFSLKCSALKKLLPYNGFYPMQRTAQLATLFSQSYGPHITGYSEPVTHLTNSLEQQEQWKLQALLQPFYAPGIMYNTIKSGIACDWAAYTGSNAITNVQPFAWRGLTCEAGPADSYSVVGSSSYAANSLLTMSGDASLSVWISGRDILSNTVGSVAHSKVSFVNGDTDPTLFGDNGWHFTIENYDSSTGYGFIQLIGTFKSGSVALEAYTLEVPQELFNNRDDLLNHVGFSLNVSEPSSSAQRFKFFVNGTIFSGSSVDSSYTGDLISTLPVSVLKFCVTSFHNGFVEEGANLASMSELTLWHTALSDTNISTLYNRGTPGYVSNYSFVSDCAVWWRLDQALDITGTKVLDYLAVSEYFRVDHTYCGVGTVLNAGSVGSLLTAPNFRIPFEACLGLENYIPSTSSVDESKIYLLEPSYYTYVLDSWQSPLSTRFNYFVWDGRNQSDLYRLASNNFFGACPKFFLAQDGLSTFVSAKEGEFASLSADTTYYMDVGLDKTNNMNICSSPSVLSDGISPPNTFSGRYYGPAVKFVGYGGETQFNSYPDSLVADPAYAPYTPPYLYGKSVVRLSFTPIESRRYSLNEILSGLRSEVVHAEMDRKALGVANQFDPTLTLSDVQSSSAIASAMSVTSSVNVFGITKFKEVEYDQDGATRIKDSNQTSYDAWSIYPRMELPILNYTGTPVAGRGPYGLWTNYCSIPQGNEGVYLSIEESFKQRATAERSTQANTGSLLTACGFTPGSKRLGELAQHRELNEAIVAIPFLERASRSNEASTMKVGDRYFFAVNKNMLIQQRKEKVNTSLTQMVEKMEKYVIPPEYDFLTYLSDSSPFVMYIMEFSTVFDKEDLANIWQGLMPKSARTVEKEEQTFSHSLNEAEFYHGKDIPEDIKFMVFKAKQKAEKSYYNLTADSRDDARFKFDFKVGTKSPEYSYNYPYDFCSLVEFAKIEAKVDLVSDAPDLIIKDNILPVDVVKTSEQVLRKKISEIRSL